MRKRKKLAVLISGRGSNMEAILKASLNHDYPAEIAVVISDNEATAGLGIAIENDIPAFSFKRTDHASKQEHEAIIGETIVKHDVDLVCLAGFMRILSATFVNSFSGRLINIHPSLLPKYKGLDTHARVLAAGDPEHGCTVHYVSEEMDGGEIIAQTRIPVLNGDSPAVLAKRVLVEEHLLYPNVIAQLCDGLRREEWE